MEIIKQTKVKEGEVLTLYLREGEYRLSFESPNSQIIDLSIGKSPHIAELEYNQYLENLKKRDLKPICPFCKEEIDFLNYDVTSTCSSWIGRDNFKDGKTCIDVYDLDSLTANVDIDNFSCPECCELICGTEEEAKGFLT